MLITIQYLEESPELLTLSPQRAAEKLKRAFTALPITHLLIGWQLPAPLLEVCRKESERAGVKFFRWHPLFTGDGTFKPRPELQVVGLSGQKVPGFRNMPEFTFVCPNNPHVSEEILQHIDHLTASGVYHGIFLDRIRWPSPAAHPIRHLGCFCEYCQQTARDQDIDLVDLQKQLLSLSNSPQGKIQLVQTLLSENRPQNEVQDSAVITQLIKFRENSITRFTEQISMLLRNSSLEIGLDCFSPGLTRMVGQNMTALSAHADWIKMMCYAHTMGPAGLPFELLGLLDFLINDAGQTQEQAADLISTALDIPLPASKEALRSRGLSSEALSNEIRKGVQNASIPTLAGMELVEIPGVAMLKDDQILRDHQAAKSAGADGLSISWDLLHIPEYRLNLIAPIWIENH